MTMDVQNNYQNYKESSTEAKVTSLCIESARTSPVTKTDMQPTALNKSAKRSFDVAFLMMPDEKLRQKPPEKHLRVSKQIFSNEEWGNQSKRLADIYKSAEYIEHTNDAKELEKYSYDDRLGINNNVSPGLSSDVNIDVGTDEFPVKYCSDSDTSERSRPDSNESAARTPKFLPESPFKNKIFDDPTLISIQTRARYDHAGRYPADRLADSSPKSAFTKVSNYALRSPNPSVSPDNLLYQNSISPPLSGASPPAEYNKAPAFNNLLPPAHLLNGNAFFKGQNVPPGYDQGTMHSASRANAGGYKAMEYNDKQTDPKTHNKLNFLSFRPEIPAYLQAGSSYPFAVQNFQSPNSDFMKFPLAPREQSAPLMGGPAAAFLSTLLPPTLAAFSLPSQNVCAKCSLSFRMTSDLVYHMRTHHKPEAAAAGRRRREDKLRCPVCGEAFRERHHLTRHMTAHQDKEGDLDDATHSSHKKSKHYNTSVTH